MHDTLTIVAFAVLFGLDYIATVPPTVALAADAFGRQNIGVVYGWIFAAHQFGAAVAALAAGLVRDRVGDYAPAFVAAGWNRDPRRVRGARHPPTQAGLWHSAT